jgi:hypothetical protein
VLLGYPIASHPLSDEVARPRSTTMAAGRPGADDHAAVRGRDQPSDTVAVTDAIFWARGSARAGIAVAAGRICVEPPLQSGGACLHHAGYCTEAPAMGILRAFVEERLRTEAGSNAASEACTD